MSRRTTRADESVWVALSDPTRRKILDLLREGPRSSGQLAAEFPTSRFAIRKHLNVLERARLVVVRWHGRERWNHLNAVPLQGVYERWVAPYQHAWSGRLAALKRHAEGDRRMSAKNTTASLERVELEIDIAVAPPKLWQALTTETTRWWPKTFYTGPAKAFLLEARIGGRLYEDWGAGAGVIWYQVFALNPGVSIDLQGNLAVPFGPGVSLLHLELAPRAEGTRLQLSDVTIGAGGGGASKAQGWQEVFGGGLKAYAESAR